MVHLAGKEGYDLERETSTAFAAMLIYKKSSPGIEVLQSRFYDTNEAAKEDIERCYKLEKQLIENEK